MKRSVKGPAYKSPLREEAARRTRHAIVEAARRVLAERGYAAMTMADVAKAANVALDTVYASVGRKPVLVALLVETAITGTDQVQAAEERSYVRAIRAATTAREKLSLYAGALADIHPRLAPIANAVHAAARSEPELAKVWTSIAERRAKNMRLFAEDLAATGELRKGLDVAEVADVVWTTGSPEMWLLLVRDRRWTSAEYATWLADAWARLFLR
jgi:AcrR family transcriptional regulator